jgi:hypothetical protein
MASASSEYRPETETLANAEEVPTARVGTFARLMSGRFARLMSAR